MPGGPVTKRPHRSRRRRRALIAIVLIGASILFLLTVHPFLAVNAPIAADTLVVEGWVPSYAVKRAADEFRSHDYTRVFVSGIGTDANRTRAALIAAGLNDERVIAAPAPDTGFNRTPYMARALRDKMHEVAWKPNGVNVITLGPHARQSRLAYGRMLMADSAVGVISIPKDDYDPARWWTSKAGWKKTTKDFLGWLKELVIGLRS